MATKTNMSDVGDGTIVVEAPSVEAALDAVTKEFGPQATIVDAERVNRGGVGGFFSKEIYRVVVEPTGAPARPQPNLRDPIDVVRGTANLVQDALAHDLAPHEATVDLRDSVVQDPVVNAVDRALAHVEMNEVGPKEVNTGSGTATNGSHGAELSAAPSFGEALRAELRMREERPTTTGEFVTDSPPDSEPIDLRLPTAPSQTGPVIDLTTPTHRQLPPALLAHAEPVHVDLPPVDQPYVIQPPSAQLVSPAELARQPLGRTTDACPPGSGAVLWSADALSRVGLPYTLIRPLADLDPADDLAWVYRLAESVAGLCGPIETTDVVLMGRNVGVLANALGLDVVVSPEAPTYTGGVAVETDLTEFNATYLENVAAGRPIHLFCGAGGDYMPRNVEAVSWCGDHLSSALHVAIETGARLAYMIRGDETIRVTPFELALAVRSRLARN